ncbi:MAG: inositol monophosphatase family protein [Thermoplasmata archaeon]
MSSADDDLELLVRLSASVHRVVREWGRAPRRGEVVGMGADGTPTEALDRVAEAEILRQLDREGVDWNLLSEERGYVARGGHQILVADPIDGSLNALGGFAPATVSLGLGNDHLASIEVGLVHDLFRGTTYWAIRGRGAFRDGERLAPRKYRPGHDLLCASLGSLATRDVQDRAGAARRIRSLGCASMEILSIAEGYSDGYLFAHRDPSQNLRVTDIAAAYRILMEAGGGMTAADGSSLDGFPLRLNLRTSIAAWGDPAYRAFLLGGTPR